MKTGYLTFLIVATQLVEGKKKRSPYNETNPNDPLYDVGGPCSDSTCIPIGKSKFHKKLQELSKSDRVSAINKYIKRVWELENPPIKAAIDIDTQIRLFATEDLDKYKIVFKFPKAFEISSKSINTKAFNEQAPFYGRKLRKLKCDDDKMENSVNTILNILIHMNNFEYSEIKEEFYALPVKFKDPIMTLNDKEIELLKLDPVNTLFKEYKEYFQMIYKELVTKLKYDWTENDMNSVFPDGIDIYDVAYAYQIAYRNYQKPYISILFSNNFDYVDTNEQTHMTSRDSSFTGFVIRTVEITEKNSIIRIPLSTKDPDMYFTIGNQNYVKEGTTCILLGLMEAKEADEHERSSQECVGRKNIEDFISLTNVMNMDKNQKRRCKGIVRSMGMNETNLLEKDNLRKAELINNKCDKPEWNRNFIVFFEKQLMYKIGMLKAKIDEIDAYIGLRKAYKKSPSNGELLKEFYEFKLRSADEVQTLLQEIIEEKKKEKGKGKRSEL